MARYDDLLFLNISDLLVLVGWRAMFEPFLSNVTFTEISHTMLKSGDRKEHSTSSLKETTCPGDIHLNTFGEFRVGCVFSPILLEQIFAQS